LSLTLKSLKGKAVFAWTDGPMSATWTISDSMSEGEIMEALLAMVKFVRVQPGEANVIPLRAVDSTVSIFEPAPTPPAWSRNLEPADRGTMGWTPAVQPPPLADLHEKIQGTGFELIGDDDELA
jgi:hypothetical protein